MITIAIAALAAMVPGSTYDPIPEPVVALEDPCAVVAALGDDEYHAACAQAQTVVAALGGYTIEQGGFRFRLLDGTTVGNGQTMAYVAELRVDTTSALTRVQYACVDTVTDEIIRADGEPVVIRTVHEVEDGWVTLATEGPCPLGSERTILTVATWSNSDEPWMESGPQPGTQGWIGGVNTIAAPGGVLTLTAGYNEGTRTGAVDISAADATWVGRTDASGILSRVRTYLGSGTGQVTLSIRCIGAGDVVLGSTNANIGNYPLWWGVENVGRQVATQTFTCPVGTVDVHVDFPFGTTFGLDPVGWSAVAAQMAPPSSGEWYVVGTISKWEKTSGIEWHPTIQDPTVGDVEGLCEDGDIQECVSRCVDLLTPGWNPLENVGDFGQFMLCLIVPQTNVGDVVGAAQHDLSETRAWQISGTVMDTVRESAMLPVTYATGCGRVLSLDFGDTFGPMSLDVTTCSVPDNFRKIVYVGTTVLGSLAILGGILYTIFWAFGWKSPVRLGDSESED